MENGTTDLSAPDTLVLIHGLWMTPLSWEHWIERYTARGFRVVARAWPGLDRPIEEIRSHPEAVAGLSVKQVVDHYDALIRELERPPIIIGHSFGGLFTQLLLDRGLGAAGVAIATAPPKGVLKLPVSTLRVGWPALHNPANNHRAAALTPEEFHYAFTNTLSDEESAKVYERYAVPGPDHLLFQAALANLNPHSETHINYKNNDRAPLLLISGGEDHISPPSVNKENYKLYGKSKAMTDYKEYPGRSHYTLGQDGWEEVADYALDWAVSHARSGSSSGDAPLVPA